MNGPRHERVRAVYLLARGLGGDELRLLLDRECRDDAGLRQEVESLLEHDDEASSFLAAPALGVGAGDLLDGDAPTSDEHAGGHAHQHALEAGARVGRYVVSKLLGAGGMGAVYEAEQREPVRRSVALKLIKPGMDSARVVTRFEAERQALALMDHPCVARVYDGGVTEEGRPYFAMELVRGVPVTEHCDRNRLTLRERLELFIRICDAVQHAHSKGVIHRDLKPRNILVEYEDGRGTPKVIDFGVAKALNQRLTDDTLVTEAGQLLGTPEYMSPEQAELSAQEIDTRSDVYSLGVVLYELLTGARPFDPETLREAGIAGIPRIIREVDPPKPSTKVAAMSSTSESTGIASARRTELRTLAGVLRQDLDWVVMKCLEKDRERRYETASALADELRRFLNDEPVEAGPPSASYRIGKFVKRNRVVVVAASFVGVAVALGLVGTTLALIHAQSERRRADQERGVAEAVSAFLLEDVVEAARPGQLDRGATLADAITAARPSVATRFADEPRLRGRVGSKLAETLHELGDPQGASEEYDRAIDSLTLAYGASHPLTLAALSDSSRPLVALQRFDEARSRLERVLDESAPSNLELRTAAAANLGELEVVAGQLERGERYLLEARDGFGRLPGHERELLDVLNNIAVLRLYQQNPSAAVEAIDELLEIASDTMSESDPSYLRYQSNAAGIYTMSGEYERAIPLFERALSQKLGVYDEQHPETLASRASLGAALSRAGRYDDALAQLVPVHEEYVRQLGPAHELALATAFSINTTRYNAGDRSVVPSLRKIRDEFERELGADHPRTLQATAFLAKIPDDEPDDGDR